MEAPKRGATRHERVAVVSDPVYAADDRRLQLAMNASGGTFRGPREASVSNLTRLPYSALEAKAVTRALGEKAAVTLEGFDATASKVLALSSADLGVLHLGPEAPGRGPLVVLDPIDSLLHGRRRDPVPPRSQRLSPYGRAL